MALDVGSLAVCSIAASSVLADLESANLEITANTKRIDAITRLSQAVGETKLMAHFDVNLFSTVSTPERVSHLNLSAATIGGTDYSAGLQRISFSISYAQKDVPGAGVRWRSVQNVTKKLSATATFAVPDTGGIPLAVTMASGTATNRNLVLSFTLNSVAITVPMRLVKIGIPWEHDGLQMYTVEFEGRDAGSGAFPTAPTGTSTLLEKALNDFKTAVAFEFETHATEGVELTGNMIFSGLNFEIADDELVISRYSFDSTGAVTVTAT